MGAGGAGPLRSGLERAPFVRLHHVVTVKQAGGSVGGGRWGGGRWSTGEISCLGLKHGPQIGGITPDQRQLRGILPVYRLISKCQTC